MRILILVIIFLFSNSFANARLDHQEIDKCIQSMISNNIAPVSYKRMAPGIVAVVSSRNKDHLKLITNGTSLKINSNGICTPSGVGLNQKLGFIFEKAFNGGIPGSASFSSLSDKQKSNVLVNCHQALSESGNPNLARELLFIKLSSEKHLTQRFRNVRNRTKSKGIEFTGGSID